MYLGRYINHVNHDLKTQLEKVQVWSTDLSSTFFAPSVTFPPFRCRHGDGADNEVYQEEIKGHLVSPGQRNSLVSSMIFFQMFLLELQNSFLSDANILRKLLYHCQNLSPEYTALH